MGIDYGAVEKCLREMFEIVKSDVAALRDLARRGGSACVPAVPAAVWDVPANLAQVLAGLPSLLRDAYIHLRVLVPDGMPEFAVPGLRTSGYALLLSPPSAPTPILNSTHCVCATRTAAGDGCVCFDECVLLLPGIRYGLELRVAPAAYACSASPRTRELSFVACMHARAHSPEQRIMDHASTQASVDDATEYIRALHACTRVGTHSSMHTGFAREPV